MKKSIKQQILLSLSVATFSICLFSPTITSAQQENMMKEKTMMKDEPAAVIKKEINNAIQSTTPVNDPFIKRPTPTDTAKKIDVEDIIDDDGDDWSAVPAFLRRKK